jgi:hypothetical protein
VFPGTTKSRFFVIEIRIVVYRRLPYALHRKDGTVPVAPLVASWTGRISRAAHPGAIPQATPFYWHQFAWNLAGLALTNARTAASITAGFNAVWGNLWS